jgi:hypothetical protein
LDLPISKNYPIVYLRILRLTVEILSFLRLACLFLDLVASSKLFLSCLISADFLPLKNPKTKTVQVPAKNITDLMIIVSIIFLSPFQIIADKFNIILSLPTISRYLKKWGFTPQRPLARSFEKNPKAVTRFLTEEFPAIKKKAKEENGEIHFLDEMGLKNNIHHYIRGYSKKGQTPVIGKTGKRLSINMISTISNNGKMRFMTYDGSMDRDKFITFLKQLIKANFEYGNKKKIFLIADNLKVHKAYKVQNFVTENKDKIEIFFLPSYSPEY